MIQQFILDRNQQIMFFPITAIVFVLLAHTDFTQAGAQMRVPMCNGKTLSFGCTTLAPAFKGQVMMFSSLSLYLSNENSVLAQAGANCNAAATTCELNNMRGNDLALYHPTMLAVRDYIIATCDGKLECSLTAPAWNAVNGTAGACPDKNTVLYLRSLLVVFDCNFPTPPPTTELSTKFPQNDPESTTPNNDTSTITLPTTALPAATPTTTAAAPTSTLKATLTTVPSTKMQTTKLLVTDPIAHRTTQSPGKSAQPPSKSTVHKVASNATTPDPNDNNLDDNTTSTVDDQPKEDNPEPPAHGKTGTGEKAFANSTTDKPRRTFRKPVSSKASSNVVAFFLCTALAAALLIAL